MTIQKAIAWMFATSDTFFIVPKWYSLQKISYWLDKDNSFNIWKAWGRSDGTIILVLSLIILRTFISKFLWFPQMWSSRFPHHTSNIEKHSMFKLNDKIISDLENLTNLFFSIRDYLTSPFNNCSDIIYIYYLGFCVWFQVCCQK